MWMIKSRYFFPVFLFLLSLMYVCTVIPQDLSQAEALERNGNRREAVKYYTVWLEQNRTAPRFYEILMKTAGLVEEIDQKMAILSSYLYVPRDVKQRYTLLKELAVLEELSGDIENAQKHYELSSFIDPHNKDFVSFLSSALLLFELGRLDRAEAQANTLVTLAHESRIILQAKLLLGRIYVHAQRIEELKLLLSELEKGLSEDTGSPVVLLSMIDLFLYAGMEGAAEDTGKKLKEWYPESVEAALAADSGSVSYLLTPSRLLRPELPQTVSKYVQNEGAVETVGVQTGSFRDRENAVYMSRDLQNLGFSAIILDSEREGRTYYKVMIPDIPMENSQHILIRLKEKGYEGFLIFTD